MKAVLIRLIKVFTVVTLGLSIFMVTGLKAEEVGSSGESKKIIIINAYHYTYQWTQNLNIGMVETLLEAYPEAVIYHEFLDWKRFPNDNLMDQIADTLNTKYEGIDFDLVLTTDDMGLTFALEHRVGLLNDAPIVFSGIIGTTAKEIIGDAKDVTGVYENMSPLGMLQLMSALQPDNRQLYVVHDMSESGIRTSQAFYEALETFDIDLEYETTDLSQFGFEEILDRISQIKGEGAVIMISYNSSLDGLELTPEIFGERLDAISPVPMYSVDEFLIDHGLTAGTFLSGTLQGAKQGELGIRILEGEDPDTIEHVAEATVYDLVDEDQLIQYDIDPQLIPENTQVLHQHFSFYETYRTLVNTTVSIITLLLILIILLIINIYQRRKSEYQVLGQKMELQDLNEELVASEEELRAQNEELITIQDQLNFEAKHDPLTHLNNRWCLEQYGVKLIEKHKQEQTAFALLFIDIDNFKFINNTHGHRIGDMVLIYMAKVLESFNESAFKARLGGDEFIVIIEIPRAASLGSIDELVKQFQDNMEEHIQVGGTTVNLSISIGYSIYPYDGANYDDLLAKADLAMYHVKKHGKSSYERYYENMNEEVSNEYVIIAQLKRALEKNELSMFYQPQVDMITGSVTGFEALIRWYNKELGQVSPAVFIPIAEKTGLIVKLGHFIMEESIKFAAIMKQQKSDLYKVSINISVVQLLERSFISDLMDLIKKYQVSPNHVQIEVTESVMIESFDIIVSKLRCLRESGIHISLDDFGTGYSSLTYIQRLPIDELKIDKSFIDNISKEGGDTSLIDTIIGIADNMKLELIAEGVEDEEQLEFLKGHGCHLGQGYLFARPMPQEEALKFFEDRSLKFSEEA